jgi:hypothetical protein
MSVLYTQHSLQDRYQIGILRGARSGQLRRGFIKQTLNFKEAQELKGRSESILKPVAILSWCLGLHPIAFSRQRVRETVPLINMLIIFLFLVV